jgi:hypothetical protein
MTTLQHPWVDFKVLTNWFNEVTVHFHALRDLYADAPVTLKQCFAFSEVSLAR